MKNGRAVQTRCRRASGGDCESRTRRRAVGHGYCGGIERTNRCGRDRRRNRAAGKGDGARIAADRRRRHGRRSRAARVNAAGVGCRVGERVGGRHRKHAKIHWHGQGRTPCATRYGDGVERRWSEAGGCNRQRGAGGRRHRTEDGARRAIGLQRRRRTRQCNRTTGDVVDGTDRYRRNRRSARIYSGGIGRRCRQREISLPVRARKNDQDCDDGK